MSSANSISGSLDEAVAFRQGVSVVTIKDQLTGMLPKMSAGTRSRLIVDGNAPESDVYFDDSMMGLGPGTIAPQMPEIKTPFFFVVEEDEFIDLYDIESPGIFDIKLTGSYDNPNTDGTVRVQIADPDDDDVYTLAPGIFTPNLSEGEVPTDHLDDLTVLLDNHTELTDDGDEKILIASSSYDSSQGITTYRVEIASAEEGSADRIKWYKNGELLTTSNDGDVITTGDGNVLIDGNNRVAVKFKYDGFDDVAYGAAQKHTVGDYWTIVAGAQQFRWKLGRFDDSGGTTLTPISGSLIAESGPIAITQGVFQPLDYGIYIKFPAQVGYDDGSDPNVDANIWEFDVVSSKAEAAITAMQEALGKIQVFPDHRTEQRDFGQPKFHNDFDVVTRYQNQISTVTIKDPSDIGNDYVKGTDQQLWMSLDEKIKNKSSADIGFLPDTDGNMSTDINGNRYWSGTMDGDPAIFTAVEYFSAASIDDVDFSPYENEDLWAEGLSFLPTSLNEQSWALRHNWVPTNSKSIDGKVGPYFTVYSLHEKHLQEQKNHIWFNYGHTSTTNVKWVDDRDPAPNLSLGVPVDISGRELVDIHMSGSIDLAEYGLYELYLAPVLSEISYDEIISGESYWTNDAGENMVSASEITEPGFSFPASQNISGDKLWTLNGTSIKTALFAGFIPDINEDGPTPLMSVTVNGTTIYDSLGVPTPLSEDDWMELHGYSLAELSEVDWMIREGYTAVQDLLHDKYFVIYDEDYIGYYVWFDVGNAGKTFSAPLASTFLNDDGEEKSRIKPREVRVKLSRTDTAEIVAEKVISRFNKVIPQAQLQPTHPFFVGSDVSKVFKASIDDSDNHVVDLGLRNIGKVQDADYQSSVEFPDGFQAFKSNTGGQGYRMSVVDNLGSPSKEVSHVSKYLKLYNVSRYWYPVPSHSVLHSIAAADRLWSNDEGLTADTASAYGWDPAEYPTDVLWAEASGYSPYVGVDANLPHYIWWNVDGITKNPAAPLDLPGKYYYDLWSYDLKDEDDKTTLRDAADNGRMLEVSINSQTINRTVAFKTALALVTENHGQYAVPFLVSTPGNQNILRIQQRDPGPISPVDDTDENPVDNVTALSENAPVSIEVMLPGLSEPDRDRDYVCDSMVFGFEDDAAIARRLSAVKRVVQNYATYEINCVAEEKNGMLFDYSHQEWEDADPGMSTGWMRPGGKSEISNYEWSADKFDPSDIPQKTLGDLKLWKPFEISETEKTAYQVGFSPNEDPDSTGSFDHMSVDSRGRKIWIIDPGVGDPDLSTAKTAYSIGLEDDEMEDEGYIEYPLSEDEWMSFEGYLPVPAFIHKIAKASYFHLPHPDKNFYVWFDTAGLSADPGDDGAFDDIHGLAGEELYDPSILGGAIRVAINSYDTAGVVAEKLAKRINHDCYDVGKKYTLIGQSDDGSDIHQAIVAGNVNSYFEAEISEDDSSIVRIVCKQPGIVSLSVLAENEPLSTDIFPSTSSGDKLTFEVIDDGDTDFFVDIENVVPGTVLPPIADVRLPDVDTGLDISVDEAPYSPTQPGVTKVLSEFLPYEDMASYSRGFRRQLDDGTEIATAGPIAYLEDDTGSLIYPVIMSNVSMKDPDQYDGVIEPLEIRSRASRNSPDGYFAAHDIRAILQTDVAEDSRKRSNPIVQYIDKEATTHEPYEDGVEHMESSPSVESFTRAPAFSGVGLNDMTVVGSYLGVTGTGMSKYTISVSDVGSIVNDYVVYDKMKWKKDDGGWSDSISLDPTGQMMQESVATFENLGGTNEYPTVGSDSRGPDSMYSLSKEIEIPSSAVSMSVSVYCKGDINQEQEYYEIQWFDTIEDTWKPLINSSEPLGTWVSPSADAARLSDTTHPDRAHRVIDTRHGYDTVPHYATTFESNTFEDITSMKFRVWSSAFVDSNIAFKNGVKIACTFMTLAAELKLDSGLSVVFDASYGHAAGDTWTFEAIARSHEDSVGSAVLPGYLTWQESRINPWKESTYHEEAAEGLDDPMRIVHYATGSLIFNYNGFDGPVDLAPLSDVWDDPATAWENISDWQESNWEKEYLKTLNGQAFTLTDSAQNSMRFEFDNDGILENEGDKLISVLRPESYILRLPDPDVVLQKRDATGDLLWEDEAGNIFGAYGTSTHPASIFGYSNIDATVGAGIPMFPDMPESEWADSSGFTPIMVSASEIAGDLDDASAYAGKYFIVTTQTDKEKDNVVTSIKGARYAVWFNIISTESGLPLAPAPEFDDSYRWTADEGKTFVVETGWSPVEFTKYMNTNESGEYLWSGDSGETITTAIEAGYTGYYNIESFEDVPPEDAISGDDILPGFEAWTEDEWATSKSYGLVSLNEEDWHAYHGWSDYKDMVPVLIEITVNEKDSIKQLVKNLVKTLRRFRNANQAKEFNVSYSAEPSYMDFYDIFAGESLPEGEDPSDWVVPDYDEEKLVKLNRNWWNSYAMDPNSPPIREAWERGWSVGWHSIRISSRNIGYHLVRDYVDDSDIELYEPSYTTISNTGTTDAVSGRDFEFTRDIHGGHKLFKDLLRDTMYAINDAPLDMTASMRYTDERSSSPCGPHEEWVSSYSIDQGVSPGTDGVGVPYTRFPHHVGLFDHVFITGKTLARPSAYPRSGTESAFVDSLPGLDIYQLTPGHEGNTTIEFHYYNDDVKGNIITQNFQNGYSAGPYMSNTIISMGMSTHSSKPRHHKSSAAGMIFNDLPCGTDSITFGGWKK